VCGGRRTPRRLDGLRTEVRAAVDVLEERDEEEGGVTAREREGERGGGGKE